MNCWHTHTVCPTSRCLDASAPRLLNGCCHLSRGLCVPQARWRQLRSCAGALESITWAYRTRVGPFSPDTPHPTPGVGKAERVLRKELVNWRQELSSGANLNNTTLRKRFSESIFKHDQRKPKADSCFLAQRWAKKFFSSRWRWAKCIVTTCCCCWTRAAQARKARVQTDKAEVKAKKRKTQIKAQTTAYCAPFRFPCNSTTQSRQFYELAPNSANPARLTRPLFAVWRHSSILCS